MESTMTLTGNLGHDIELKKTKTGISTVTFRVATTPRIRTDDGWIDGSTTWTTVVCYRALAENIKKSVSKGDPVIVHGRIRTQSWQDDQGVCHERLVVEASGVGHDLNRGVAGFVKSYQGPNSYQVPEPPETPTAPTDETEIVEIEDLDEPIEELELAMAA